MRKYWGPSKLWTSPGEIGLGYIQCGPSMTSWVDPHPPSQKGMDQLKRVWIDSNLRVWIDSIKGCGLTQDVIDGPHCTFLPVHSYVSLLSFNLIFCALIWASSQPNHLSLIASSVHLSQLSWVIKGWWHVKRLRFVYLFCHRQECSADNVA